MRSVTKTTVKKPRTKKSTITVDPVAVALETASHGNLDGTFTVQNASLQTTTLPAVVHEPVLMTAQTSVPQTTLTEKRIASLPVASPHILDLHDIALSSQSDTIPSLERTHRATYDTQTPDSQRRLQRAWNALFTSSSPRNVPAALDLRPRPISQFPPKESENFSHALQLTYREWRTHKKSSASFFTFSTTAIRERIFYPIGEALSTVRIPRFNTTKTLPQKSIATQTAPAIFSSSNTALFSKTTPTQDDLPQPSKQSPLRYAVIGFSVVLFVIATSLAIGAVTLLNRQILLTSDIATTVAFLKQGEQALQAQDSATALTAFTNARTQLQTADRRIGFFGKLTLSAATLLPTTHPIRTAKPLLDLSNEFAVIGQNVSAAFLSLSSTTSPENRIALLTQTTNALAPRLSKVTRIVNGLPLAAVPVEAQSSIKKLQEDIPTVTRSAKKVSSALALLPEILGMNAPRRYLLLFQNNAEIRATGGFIGSFALVDIDKGELKNWEIPGGGSYDLKGSLLTRVASPQPLHLINAEWQFQDANWYADFPTSAQTVTRFYEKSGGPTTDGVIAINARLMERLLDIVGPIELPAYNKTITSKNFAMETQKAVELEYDKTKNKPKQFIADLWPTIIEKIQLAPPAQQLQMAQLLDQSLIERDAMIWLRDAKLETRARGLGWTGDLKKTTGDYLAIVHTNIAGQKTDAVMQDDVSYSVKILPDKTVVATLTLQRTHNGKKGELFRGVRNVDYVRFYVPLGSKLVEASGFSSPNPTLFTLTDPTLGNDPMLDAQENASIFDQASGMRTSTESGKTVFGNWIQTDPGKTSAVTLTYTLPNILQTTSQNNGVIAKIGNKLRKQNTRTSYSLLVQKQPGANPQTFTSSLSLPRDQFIAWQSPERMQNENGTWVTSSVITQDVLLSTVLEER